MQEFPAGSGNHDPARDAQRRYGNAEEGKNVGTDEQRNVEHQKTVEGDAPRQFLAQPMFGMPRDVEKYQRTSGGIDDWKCGGEHQQEENAEIFREAAAHPNRPHPPFSAIGPFAAKSHRRDSLAEALHIVVKPKDDAVDLTIHIGLRAFNRAGAYALDSLKKSLCA